MNVLRGLGIQVDLEGNGDDELLAWMRALKEARGGAEGFAGSLNTMEREMIDAAKNIGLSRDQLRELVAQTKQSSQVRAFANQYGFSMSDVSRQSDIAANGVGKIGSAIQNLAALPIIQQIGTRLFGGFRDMIQTALAAKGAFAGLSAVVRANFGEQAVPAAIESVRQLKVNLGGLVDESALADATKALTSMGYSAGDATKLVEANIKAHMVAGNQTYSSADAIRVYAKALKDGNSATIDVTGNSANLDQIMKSLGFSMSDLSDPVKGNEARLAYMNYQLKWAGMYAGEADKMMSGFKGQVAQLNSISQESKIRFGELLQQGLTPLLENAIVPFFKALSGGLKWIFENQAALTTLKIALMLLIPFIGIYFLIAMGKAILALGIFNNGLIAALWPAYAVIAVIGLLALAIEDIYTWITGGDSIIGSWLGPWKDVIGGIRDFFVDTWNNILAFFSSIPERIVAVLGSLKGLIPKLLSFILPPILYTFVAKATGLDIEGRAGGGPVSSGTPYIVGEQGPELFVPGSSGAIIPNGSLGGKSINITIAPVINVNGTASRDDAESIAAAVERAIENLIPGVRAQLGLEAI